ncbi:TonB-dependent receptor [Prevotella sp. OH937_COT-195]|nr:TonB-dependent receptor [Prevotella sp. OH937_COT-195]
MKNYFVQSKIRYTTVFRFLSSFVFFVISVFAFPQNVKTWKIRVTDLENLSVIGVRLKLNICEREIEGFTDENGILKYQLSECDTCTRAFISVRSNMYMPLDTIVDFSSSVDSEITLMPKALDEVEVVGYKTISKGNAEKVTFKTDFTKGLLKSAKADIALRRIPNIVYSGGSFMFTGKQKKAKLFVNGMEVPDEELSKIDAKDIYKVELHRVSLNDDKYSGEINVVLKKSLNAQYSGEIDMGTNLLNTGFGVNPLFKYRSKKIEVTTWVSYVNDRQNSQYKRNRNDEDVFLSDNHNHLKQYGGLCRLNMFFSPRWMSSLSYSMFGYKSPADISWQLYGVTQPEKEVEESYFSNFANMVIRHDINAGERFYIKARYFNYKSENRSTMPVTRYIGRMNEYTGDLMYEADSVSLFNKYHSVAAGYKSIYRNSTLTSSDKTYISDVQQFYIKDNILLNDKWSMFVLLRGDWDGHKFENGNAQRKFSFLPSCTVNYGSGKGSLSATYTRSIERPGIDYLNPDVYYINDMTRFKGNSKLKSKYTDRYSVNYSRQIKDSYLTAVMSYENTDNFIGQIYLDDYNTSTYENTGHGHNYRMDVAFNKPFLSNKLNLNLSVGTMYKAFKIKPYLKDKALNGENKGWAFICSGNLSYMMPKEWFLNLSMDYTSRDITFNTVTYVRPMLNILLTKALFRNHLNISLQYIDMFGLARKRRVECDFKGIRQTSTCHLATSRLSISVVYHFGKQFRGRSVGETIDNEDMITK